MLKPPQLERLDPASQADELHQRRETQFNLHFFAALPEVPIKHDIKNQKGKADEGKT